MINKKQKNYWEIPEVDLNLRHYSGSVFNVFKKIKQDIILCLTKKNINEETKKIYSAIYNALDYYEIISPDFSVDSSFLDSTIETFNEDLEYLSEKYKSDSIFEPPVISFNARIKSPLSFTQKVKDKVNEYLDQNRDFVYFNESLRDIIGVRIIIDPPKSVKDQGLQAESDYVYNVFYDLMCHRGILDESNETKYGNFRFLDVNTRYDPTKLESIKKSQYYGKFIYSDTTPTKEEINDLENYNLIVKPKSRPAEIEKIDNKIKDYRLHPKKSGYQSIHVCIVPYYSKLVEKAKLPNCIIPPATTNYTIEYQFRDARENDYSEYGPASHSNLKPYEKNYHRLAVPSFIDSNYSNLPEELTSHSTKRNLRIRNFGDSYQKFYGPSFEDRFNITYHMFKYTFNEETQDDILAGKKVVFFNELTNTYYAENNLIPICVDENNKNIITDSKATKNFIESNNLDDSNIHPNISENYSKDSDNIQLLKFISSDDTMKSKENKSKFSEFDRDK